MVGAGPGLSGHRKGPAVPSPRAAGAEARGEPAAELQRVLPTLPSRAGPRRPRPRERPGSDSATASHIPGPLACQVAHGTEQPSGDGAPRWPLLSVGPCTGSAFTLLPNGKQRESLILRFKKGLLFAVLVEIISSVCVKTQCLLLRERETDRRRGREGERENELGISFISLPQKLQLTGWLKTAEITFIVSESGGQRDELNYGDR